jgi:hypothetical protein
MLSPTDRLSSPIILLANVPPPQTPASNLFAQPIPTNPPQQPFPNAKPPLPPSPPGLLIHQKEKTGPLKAIFLVWKSEYMYIYISHFIFHIWLLYSILTIIHKGIQYPPFRSLVF